MDLELIRRILVEAKTVGVEQTTAQLKGLSVGYEGVAVASQKTESATEAATRKFQRLEGYLDPAARAARQLAKDISTLDAQLAQTGNIERHNELLSIATANALKMSEGVTKATAAQKLWGEVTAGASAQAQMFASRAGPLGYALSSLGKAGLVAGAGIGIAVVALRALDEQSHAVGQKAIELKKFSDTTGLTVTQVQALRNEATKFGLSGDQVETALQKFTTNFEELRNGGGTALAMLQRYKPGLDVVMQGMDNTGDAIGVLRKAFDGLSISQQNALSKAFFGKAGIEQAQLFKQLDLAAITQKYAESGRGLNEEQMRKLAKLEVENQELRRIAGESFAKLFAADVIEAENSFLRGLIEINHELKEAAKNGSTWNAVKRAASTVFPVASQIVGGAVDVVKSRDPEAAAAKAHEAETQSILGLFRRQQDLNDAVIAYEKEITDAGNNPWADNLVVKLETAKGELESVNQQLEQANNRASSLAKDAGLGDIGKKGGAESEDKSDPLLRTLESVMAKQKENIQVLGALASVEDIVALKENELAVARKAATGVTDEQARSLTALARVQAELAAVAPGTYERQLKELEKLKAAYPGLTAAQAGAARALDQQLALANAVTAAEKMQVQEAINFTNAKGPGVTAEQAHATAAKQTAIAQAQINAAAKDQLFALQNAAAGAAAVTGQQRISAQFEATINQLKRQNVDATLAEGIAEQERANAIKQANAAVQQTIHGIENEIELINTRSESEKNSVLIRQAYNDAIRSGADAQTASALASAVAQKQNAEAMADQNAKAKAIQVTEANRATEISKANRAIQDQNDGLAESIRLAIEYNKWVERIYAGETLLSQMDFNVPKPGSGGSTTSRIDTGIPFTPGSIRYGGGGGGSTVGILGTPEEYAKQAAEEKQARDDKLQKQIDQFETSRIKAQLAGDKGAEISAVQGELGFYQKQPESLANLQQIKSLTDTLKQLTDATKDNTASQNALSGLYSRQFGQGFYDGGAAVGELIYGLDNNTSGAIDDMQKAANDNTRNQNDLLKDLSQKQVSTFTYTGAATVTATNNVQNELRTGFSFVVSTLDKNAAAARTQQGSTIPAPTNPNRLPGFAAGGSFTTQGSGADDSNVVAFRVSPQRERVTIAPATGAAPGAGGTINHYYNNDITITIPQNTDEFRSSAMQVADEIFNQVAIAGRRK